MKSRDIIGLIIALVVLAVCGILLYTQLAPAPQDSGIQVTVPRAVVVPLSTSASQDSLGTIKGLTDFSVPQRCDDKPELCNRNGASPI